MQNLSKELRQSWDADAPQSMNADVQDVPPLDWVLAAQVKMQMAGCFVWVVTNEFQRAPCSWQADHESEEPRGLAPLRPSVLVDGMSCKQVLGRPGRRDKASAT
ncbi:hypothetical protein ETH_00006605 [Eimeria tenella]|uniref:Uncharacterized protein n=1 Tax=Eimeria tenella TaxID=5802 RepID=U6L246_EIMTE|nr:hypothetical protein ETH_00006605 [Eimeria tenella]CDJ42674.1 hypothetical protein ETH_00006605 [Eimeria tenella]|eukprot:XP_013233424.1 hypothetical protein ETH_00006605 [Eimeria tenella]